MKKTVWVLFLFVACVSSHSPRGPLSTSHSTTNKMVIYFSSDLHAHLLPIGNRGGFARIASFIQQRRQNLASDTRSLGILGGDLVGKGALPCQKTHENSCLPLLKEMGFDVAVPGNDDLKEGEAQFFEWAKVSGLDWVSSNARWKNTAPTFIHSVYQPPEDSILFLGLTMKDHDMRNKKNSPLLEDSLSPQQITNFQKRIGRQPWVLLAYQEEPRLMSQLEEFCKKGLKPLAVLLGHAHAHREELSACAPIFETHPYGQEILEIAFEKRDDVWQIVSHQFFPMDEKQAEDVRIRDKIAKLYKEQDPDALKILGSVKEERSQEQLAMWYADALKNTTKADISIVHLGSVSEGIQKGDLSWDLLFQVFPNSEPLMGLDISKLELEKSLCAANKRVRSPDLDFASELMISGAQLKNTDSGCRLTTKSPRGSFKVVLTKYLLSKSERWLGKNLQNRAFSFGISANDALKRYVGQSHFEGL